jgi:hypothetical protein
MHARVTRLTTTPDKVGDVQSAIEGTVIPTLKGIAGFAGGHFLADRSTGECIGITLFETEEAVKSSRDMAAGIRDKVMQQTGATFTGIEEYEVIAQA